MKIGFIGIGIMGGLMAANLQAQGHELVIYNRTKSKTDNLVAKGAVIASSPADVAHQSNIIFTMLPHPEAVETVALGTEGFLNALNGNSFWIDCSTVNPSFAQKMAKSAAQNQVNYIDAPVAGSKNQAEQKELVFLVGANKAHLNSCESLLKCMGKKVVHVGEPGMGNALKLVFNLLLGISMAGFAEAMILGEALGISQNMLLDILVGSPVVSPYMKDKKDKLAKSHYDPEFPLQWMQKDLQMVAIAGYKNQVPLPLANATKEIYQQAIQQGLGQQDFTAIYDFWRSTSKDWANSDKT
ncbi:MAG: NAD(P)-dependent oxidoreductase [Pleurocapsa sp.]